MWNSIYTLYPPEKHGHGEVLHRAKSHVAEYLLTKSYELSPAKLKIRELEDTLVMLNSAARHKPHPALKSRIEKEEANLREAKKGGKISVWWSYLASLGEEVSSKVFYRRFRSKLSSTDFSSIHITPDWNDPEAKSGVSSDPKDIAVEQETYYKMLFGHKPSARPGRMLALLRERQINQARAKRMEEPLTGKEVSEAIGRLAKGKAPGPDSLPAELYKDFEHLVAQPLLDTFTEAHREGSLVEALRQGDVTLHYKKGDPREIRNYRPITLLNVDYKILAHVLVKRLKTVMDDIISKEQLGFVPGREISESTLFLKLVQAKLEEDDLEGIIVACDWEKAFDRVSWDYLHQATEALGFGPYMCSWLKVLYNTDAPPNRVSSPTDRDPIRSRSSQAYPKGALPPPSSSYW